MKITVNAREHEFPGSQITYGEVVGLAGMTGRPTVTYRGRPDGDSQRAGTMLPMANARLVLSPGMVFAVAHTGNA